MFRAAMLVVFTVATAAVVFLALGPAAPASSSSTQKGKPGTRTSKSHAHGSDCNTCPMPSN